MIGYPKLETLYNRLPNFSVDTTVLRVPAWGNVKNWLVTEKIDGMNIRIGLHADGSVEYNGRTDNAQLPSTLVAYLRVTFNEDVMRTVFKQDEAGVWPEVVVFGEGYGPKIQNGHTYRPDVAVRIFDVSIGDWWLEWDDVVAIAERLGARVVPVLCQALDFPRLEGDLHDIAGISAVATGESGGPIRQAEGIVARAYPMLLTRDGARCMYKLKMSDFRGGKR